MALVGMAGCCVMQRRRVRTRSAAASHSGGLPSPQLASCGLKRGQRLTKLHPRSYPQKRLIERAAPFPPPPRRPRAETPPASPGQASCSLTGLADARRLRQTHAFQDHAADRMIIAEQRKRRGAHPGESRAGSRKAPSDLF